MNEIINTLHKGISNLEIALQTSSQILDRSQTIIDDDLSSPKTNMIITQQKLSRKSVRNSIDTLSQRSVRNCSIPDQHILNSILEKQFHKLNLSSHVSFDQTTLDNSDLPNISLNAG
jgi:hypothetical protein